MSGPEAAVEITRLVLDKAEALVLLVVLLVIFLVAWMNA